MAGDCAAAPVAAGRDGRHPAHCLRQLANLLIGAGAARTGEVLVRTALGAGRVRIVRQLSPRAWCWRPPADRSRSSRVCRDHVPVDDAAPWLLPKQQIDMDLRVLAFAAGLSVVAGLLFGLAPAFACRASRQARAFARAAARAPGRRVDGCASR